jgi:glutathione S-transferase
MKLIGTPTSPYTRKVRIVLAEKHIEYDFIVDNPNTPDTHVSEHNPLGKIPVLILDDETTLFDSRVIVDYLDSASPVARLIPEDTRRRIQTRRWEALADGCADAAVAIVYERRRPTDKQFAETLTRQQGKVDRALKAMADELGDKAWCNGDHYSLADIAVGCALCFIELRLTDLIGWRKPYPNLVRLVDKLALRPTFRETEPPKA